MRSATVNLGGKPYEIQELRSRANRAWRKSLAEHFSDVAFRLEGAPNVELSDGKALAELVRSVGGKLLESVDILTGLVREYAPDLPINDDSYDSEVLEAFTAVAGLAYPFWGNRGPVEETGWLTESSDWAELALSQWGQWDDELDPFQLAELGRAYMRREQWRARLQAVAVAKVLVGDDGGKSGSASRTIVGHSGKRYRMVAPAEMLKIAGVSG